MSKKRKKAPRRYNPVDWDNIEDLGKVPDSVIADRMGVSSASVCQARKRRGIPPYARAGRPPLSRVQKKKRMRALRKATKDWDWSKTDRELADEERLNGARVSHARVYQIRIELGIPLSSQLKSRKS